MRDRNRPRIALIGAGSLSHGKRLIDDLLTIRALDGGTLVLMGLNLERLAVIERYTRRMAAALLPSLEVLATTDRRQALGGARIVLSLFDAGGFHAFDADVSIVRRYGIDNCIGDTVGPTGILRGLRNAGVMLDVARDAAEICPEALILNYVNPMAVMVAAANAAGAKNCVGICGGIEATRGVIARLLGEEPNDLEMSFGGVNHLCWALAVKKEGRDLYPLLKERMADPGTRGNERVRFEILQQFGYFVTESSGHISDFFPWFRRNAELRRRYCAVPGNAGASWAYHKYAAFVQRRIGQVDYLNHVKEPTRERSSGYGASIVEAMLDGRSYDFYGNVMNDSGPGPALIDNLSREACVEVPVSIEGGLPKSRAIGPLPAQLAALCAPSGLIHALVLRAVLDENPELAFAAMATDPLTASVLDLPEIRRMTGELLSANRAYLAPGLSRGLIETVELQEGPSAASSRHEIDPLIELVRTYERRRRRTRTEGSGPSRGS